MALQISTPTPQALLDKIKKLVRTGEVYYWAVDDDGDFKMASGDYERCGWVRANVGHGTLSFGIVAPKDSKMSRAAYAELHGQFSAMLLRHFDEDFLKLTITARQDGVHDKF